MKRTIGILFMLCTIFLLCSCADLTADESPAVTDETSSVHTEPETDDVLRGVWITSFELTPESFEYTAQQYAAQMAAVFERLAAQKINNVFVQVRANSDALYFSELYPASERLSGTQGVRPAFDALEILVELAHSRSMKLHAWINPYRVSASSSDPSALSEDNPARKWYEADDNSNVYVGEAGIYLNPASEQVQRLVLDGVRELLDNYGIDGVHIDDYFYPTTAEEIDRAEYSRYIENGGKLSLGDFRRQHVSSLVSAMYRAVKAKSPRLLFTVSPCGDIEKSISQLYADVGLWSAREGYADYIIPQIYYGFENDVRPFGKTLDEWLELCPAEKLCVGLALYKRGREDVYAGSASNEWIENDDVIDRQIAEVVSRNCAGYCLFSAGYVG